MCPFDVSFPFSARTEKGAGGTNAEFAFIQMEGNIVAIEFVRQKEQGRGIRLKHRPGECSHHRAVDVEIYGLDVIGQVPDAQPTKRYRA
jgi:hypothetical protein